MTDKLTNAPVTPSREMLELLEEWAAPDVSDIKKASVVGKTNFMGMSIEDMYKKKEKQEPVPEEEEVKPLTAEEIDQIRQDAYQEGFAQGKEEGIAAGHEEGLELGHKDGIEKGHAEGFESGLAEGQTEIQEAIKRWNTLAEQLVSPIERVDKAAEQQLLNLAVMLAESVLRTEIKANKESLLAALHESVAALPFNTEFAEIHLHPEDIELLQTEYSDDMLAEQKWILKPEANYQRGDVIVATPNSLIDRTVAQRMSQTLDEFVHQASLDKETNTNTLIQPEHSTEYNQPDEAERQETVVEQAQNADELAATVEDKGSENG